MNGVRQSYGKASEMFAKACDLNRAGGCFNLGLVYTEGKAAKRDYLKALDLYKKACGLGHSGGCFNHARLHRRIYRKSDETVMEYLDKACKLGLKQGCDMKVKLSAGE